MTPPSVGFFLSRVPFLRLLRKSAGKVKCGLVGLEKNAIIGILFMTFSVFQISKMISSVNEWFS